MKGVIQFISGQKAWHKSLNSIVMDRWADERKYNDLTRPSILGSVLHTSLAQKDLRREKPDTDLREKDED